MLNSMAVLFAILLTTISGLSAAEITSVGTNPPAPVDSIKQSVFLFCPHKEGKGAWSLYVLADKKDPSKILSLGLEELAGKNSKELTYRGVLAAQNDPATPRNDIARIDSKDFATGKLELQDKSQLSMKIDPAPEGFKLTIDARIGTDDHFVVGGAEQDHRNMILKYNMVYKCWQITASKLANAQGQETVGKFNPTLTGIVFTTGASKVSRICTVDEAGECVILLDR